MTRGKPIRIYKYWHGTGFLTHNSYTDQIFRALRLTCRSFAYLQIIERRLFSHLHVCADADGLRLLQSIRVRDSPIARYANSLEFHGGRLYHDFGEGLEGEGLEKQDRLNSALVFLRSESLKKSWANALKEIERPISVAIGSTGLEDDHEVPEHDSTADALFESAMESLARAQVPVHTLKIETPLSEFKWERLPTWDRLDLSQLHALEFRSSLEPHWESEAAQEAFYVRANAGIASIMKKCSTSLKEFCYTDGPMCWPGKDVVPLPNLRTLDLTNLSGFICTRNIASWIGEMPRLQRMAMDGVHLGERTEGWLALYDAVRLHMVTNKPAKFECEWSQYMSSGIIDISFHQDLGNLDSLLEEGRPPADSDLFEISEWDLAMYMTGRGVWTDELEEWAA